MTMYLLNNRYLAPKAYPWGYGSPLAQDQYWTQTVLAMPMDGEEGATNFTDLKGKTIIHYGETKITSAQSKFGGKSAYFDGSGDYLGINDNEDFNFGSGEFTVELWMKSPGNVVYDQLLGQRDAGGGAAIPFGLCRNNTANTIIASYRNAGGTLTALAGTIAVFNDVWHHVAFVRQGDSLKLYIDGVLDITMNLTTGYSLYNSTDMFSIGRAGAYNNQYFKGYMDDIRITKGVARYTAAFTPSPVSYIPVL